MPPNKTLADGRAFVSIVANESMTPEVCPNCGAQVPPKARACPQCGADEQTGWSPEAYEGGLDLPDDSFKYDEYVEREFGGGRARPYGIRWFWWCVALLTVLAFIWSGWRFLF
jgi:ribosomal protein L40E